MNYHQLTADKATEGSVRNYVNQNVPVAILIRQAESYLFRRLRVRDQLTTVSGTIASGDSTVTLPTDYLAAKQIKLTGPNNSVLTRKLPEALQASITYSSGSTRTTGVPTSYYTDGSNIVFDLVTNAAYTYEMIYFNEPAPLTSSNATNFLTQRYPRMLLAATCAFANEYLKDDAEKQYWMAIAMGEIDQAMRESDFERQGTLLTVATG
jgi:hypothetical protein|tara:strand:+ start:322 stop:948 length:627 start_codon:yes stop_codon:yes gene_type:complete